MSQKELKQAISFSYTLKSSPFDSKRKIEIKRTRGELENNIIESKITQDVYFDSFFSVKDKNYDKYNKQITFHIYVNEFRFCNCYKKLDKKEYKENIDYKIISNYTPRIYFLVPIVVYEFKYLNRIFTYVLIDRINNPIMEVLDFFQSIKNKYNPKYRLCHDPKSENPNKFVRELEEIKNNDIKWLLINYINRKYESTGQYTIVNNDLVVEFYIPIENYYIINKNDLSNKLYKNVRVI